MPVSELQLEGVQSKGALQCTFCEKYVGVMGGYEENVCYSCAIRHARTINKESKS